MGEINNKELLLNDAGKMIEQFCLNLEEKFQNIKCDNYIVMPNHLHFILEIEHKKTETTLSKIIQWFKTETTNEYIRNVKYNNWKPFDCKLWQRNYYEHIIRNETEYENIFNYINNNPANWKNDNLP